MFWWHWWTSRITSCSCDECQCQGKFGGSGTRQAWNYTGSKSWRNWEKRMRAGWVVSAKEILSGSGNYQHGFSSPAAWWWVLTEGNPSLWPSQANYPAQTQASAGSFQGLRTPTYICNWIQGWKWMEIHPSSISCFYCTYGSWDAFEVFSWRDECPSWVMMCKSAFLSDVSI